VLYNDNNKLFNLSANEITSQEDEPDDIQQDLSNNASALPYALTV